MKRVARIRVGVLVWLCAAASMEAVWATDKLPVPIKKDLCFKAELHDKVQGHLLFSYFVTAQGGVEQVRTLYVKVEPAALESKLVGALRLCMEGWTFKPGTRDGRTARIGMMTPFHFFRPAPPDDPEVTLYGGTKIGRSRLEEMREAKLDLIQHLLSGPPARDIPGPGWILRTDLGGKDVKVVLEAFERAVRLFEAAFPGAPPVPEDRQATIVIFRDGLSHSQVDAFDNLQPTQYGSRGTYSSSERLMSSYKGFWSTPALIPHLVHEMAHHLIAYRLPGEMEHSSWLHEGVASFIECLKEERNGAVDWKKFERGRIASGFLTIEWMSESNLRVLEAAVKRNELLPLPKLMETPGQQFVGDPGDLLYAQSWLLIHYLFNAEGGRFRVPFQAWLVNATRQGGPEGLAAALGVPLAQIESALPAYLESLK